MWMAFLGLSLRRYWEDVMGEENATWHGHSLKLPNLLMNVDGGGPAYQFGGTSVGTPRFLNGGE